MDPPSTPTLDWLNGGANIPPEVSAAIGRMRMGAGDERDRSAIVNFMIQNGDQLDGATLTELSDLIGGQTQPVAPTTADTGFNYVPGGGDIRSQQQAQAAAQAPANLPTPAPPQPISTAPSGLPSPIQGSPSGSFPGQSSTYLQNITTQSPRIPMTANIPADASRGQVPMDVSTSQRLPRDTRMEDPTRRGGRNGAGTNWKGIEGGGNSAFSDISPQYLSAYADSPAMASQEIAAQGLPPGANANLTGKAMEPLVGSALEMAKLGLLGGGRGHGLGGPSSAGGRLQRAESLVNSLGPGQYIDPGYVMRKTVRRAGKTDVADLYSGQGDPNDITQQVDTTNNAILAPLKGVATDDAYNGTAAMLQQESMAWLQAVAHGEIDPNVDTYPAWLRSHKRQKFLGR